MARFRFDQFAKRRGGYHVPEFAPEYTRKERLRIVAVHSAWVILFFWPQSIAPSHSSMTTQIVHIAMITEVLQVLSCNCLVVIVKLRL